MSWITKTLSSSIGRKLIMGVTGLFLCSFLIVHCGINALIFANDHGALFNAGAEFMGTNILIRTMEIVLFLGILLHIYQALILTIHNNKARKTDYVSYNGNANSKWYSRSMGLLGTLLLIFLIIHLKHFWYVSRLTDHLESGETLFDEMKEIFENPIWVILYVLGNVSLAYHLLHGFQSGFRSLGLTHRKYTPIIQGFGAGFSIIIPLIFALMPLAIFFKIIQ